LARVRLGADPRADKIAKRVQHSLTFRAVADRYLKAAAERLKVRSYEEVCRHLSKDWRSLSDLPFKSIDRPLVAMKIAELAESNGPIAANRARASLSALYSFALSLGLCDQNPVVGTIKPGREVTRDHVLSDNDIAAIWRDCGASDYGRMVKLLLLTGQRRDEVGNMRWSEIDLEKATWTLPSSRTKNRRSHEVPLTEQSLVILDRTPRVLGRDHVFGNGQNGFSGWSKSKASLDARLAQRTPSPSPWRIHDLRRTAAT
jgi:integrase